MSSLAAIAGIGLMAVPALTQPASAVQRDWRAGANPMATIPVGILPDAIAVDQHTGTVWVADGEGNGTVSEISEAKRAVVATIKVGAWPLSIAADPRTGTVWVGCLGPSVDSGPNIVNEISESTRKVIATIGVGKFPGGIGIDSRTGTVWVTNENSESISKISESGRDVTSTISTGPGEPSRIAVDQATGHLWVAMAAIKIDEISEATGSIIGQLSVDPGHGTVPDLTGIAVNQQTSAVWVTSNFNTGDDSNDTWNYTSLINPNTRKIVASIQVPKPGSAIPNGAQAVATDPGTGTVWVAENGFSTVTLISAGRRTVARNLPTGFEPYGVAVDPVTKTVWLANNHDSTVTMYQYSRPRFTTRSHVTVRAGRRATFTVRTSGFPFAEMSRTGTLPRGLRVKIGHGTITISGTPALSARNHTYRITIAADNGIGTAKGQYIVTQQLTIKVS